MTGTFWINKCGCRAGCLGEVRTDFSVSLLTEVKSWHLLMFYLIADLIAIVTIKLREPKLSLHVPSYCTDLKDMQCCVLPHQ